MLQEKPHDVCRTVWR